MDSFDQKAKNDIHFTFSGTAEKKKKFAHTLLV